MTTAVVPGSEILNITDYPPSIRGSLRLMLQLKDAFISCFNLVEEYRSQLLACQRGFAREIVVYQLSQGLASIIRLREDLEAIESKSHARANRNTALRSYLVQRYGMETGVDSPNGAGGILSRLGQDEKDTKGGTGTAVVSAGLPPPVCAPDSVEAALHGGLDHFVEEVNVDIVQVPNEIDLATCTTEAGTPLLPVVEFYRGFFFLQMHFQLIMCQAANYAMPVVTRSMGLAERAFAWPSMPSFGLSAASGSMRDRLMEINTEVLQLAQRLHACLAMVRDKLQQDKRIESYYFQHTAAQEALRRNLLRCLQSQRVYLDCLETQNDRLAGLAIKLDPSFSKTSEFTLMTGTNMGNLKAKDWNQSSNPMGIIDTSDNDSDDYPTRDENGIGRVNTLEISNNHEGLLKHENGHNKISGNEQYSSSRESADLRCGGLPSKIDTNVSASARHQPTMVVQPGSSRKQQNEEVISEPKVMSLRGGSRALDELLIGFDSVAANGPKLDSPGISPMLAAGYHAGTPITDAVKQIRAGCPATRPAERTLLEPMEPHTPSLRGSQMECFPSTASVPPRQPQIVSNKVTGLARPASQSTPVEFSHSAAEASDYTDNTLDDFNPRSGNRLHVTGDSGAGTPTVPLDTNVNASGFRFPKLVNPPTGEPLPPKRPQHSESAVHLKRATAINPPVASATAYGERIGDYTRRLPPAAAGSVKPKLSMNSSGIFPTFEDIQHENQMLRLAVEGHVQPVTSVGTTECGAFCAPDWTGRSCENAKRRSKPDDLLNEPKRSAVNKALVAHRSRLVETILQADGEKLEELIALLMKE